MLTSQPFRFFSPTSYVRKRYSPLLAAYIEPTVDDILKKCGFSFIDIFASLGSRLRLPIRIYPHDKIRQQNFNEFIIQVTNELKEIGSTFLDKDYEETYKYDTTAGPFPNLLHQDLAPDTNDARYPAWYRILLYRLFESLLFSDYEFHDIPIGILYVVDFGRPCKNVNEIRQVTKDFPEWMREFSKEIPVACLVVGDNQKNPVIPEKLVDYRKSGFAYTTSINICQKGRNLNTDNINEYFGWDYKILKNPNLGENFSLEDVTSIDKVFNEIFKNFVNPELFKLQKYYESESDKLNKFSKTIQTWFFKKGEPEKVTEYLKIPVKKISYLQHAAYSMLLEIYQPAQRSYRYFLSSMSRDDQPLIQARAQVSALLSDLMLNEDNNDLSQFVNDVKEIAKNRQSAVCLRGALIAPLLALEFCCHIKDWSNAIDLCRISIGIIEDLYAEIKDVKNVFLGVIFERIVGLENREKHKISMRAMAAYSYRDGNQEGHALRCFLWLLSSLPKDVWNRLWQTVALEKVMILSEQNQMNRSLHDIAYLMSVTNMSDDLQNLLLTQFLSIFNDRNADIKSLAVELKPLLYVKKVKMFDPSQPEFYGYSKYEFKKMIEKFNLWFSAHVSRSSSVSFEEIWNNGDSIEEEIPIVPCGVELKVEIGLINHHIFTIQLTDSSLDVTYTPIHTTTAQNNNSSNSENFSISTVPHIDIHGSKLGNSRTKFALKVTPYSQGKYTINRLVNSYWGYINSFIEFNPISFLAYQDYPRIKISVVDLPKKVVAHQCIPFYLSIENQGNISIIQHRILCDPFLVYEEGKSDFNKHVQIVTLEKQLESMSSILVPFIYHVPESKEGCDFIHFVIDVQGVKCAYQKVEVKIEKKTIISIEKLSMKNETLSRILKCKFKSENGKFVSIFKKDGSLLKTFYNTSLLPLNNSNEGSSPNLNLFGNLNINVKSSNSGSTTRSYSNLSSNENNLKVRCNTVLAYLDKSDEKIDDEWRCRLLKHDEIGVLYEIKGSEYLAQANVKIPRFEEEERFLEEENEDFYHFKLHIDDEKMLCRVFLFHYDGPNLFIEPLPIQLELQNDNKINGCSWVGKKRQIIGKDHDAIFKFKANIEGIAKINGFLVSTKRDFTNPKVINISQTFQLKKK